MWEDRVVTEEVSHRGTETQRKNRKEKPNRTDRIHRIRNRLTAAGEYE
jgi:hypothetical protein